MTEADFQQEAAELTSRLQEILSTLGPDVAKKMHDAAGLTLEWVGYLSASKVTGHCDHFLDGLRSLVLEAAASAAAGLYRSSMFSMRAQIDVSLSWLYFKDHAIEWEKVERENEGYKLKKDSLDYLGAYYSNFSKRLNLLNKFPGRSVVDPYRILSAHIHSTGVETVPKLAKFADVVGDEKFIIELIELQESVSEYISDVFMSVYGSGWASLPSEIVLTTKSRLPVEQCSVLLS